MKTAHQNLGVESLSRNGARLLPNMWIKWAVFFFFVAALFGLALRYFFIGHLPAFVDYKNILHAHSHLALLGWGYLLVSGMLLFTFVPQPLRRNSYKIILILNILANLGMMATFPVQGYGPGSIAFSTLHLLVSYVFAFRFLKDIKGLTSTPYLSLIKYGVRWMVLSSVGLWSIAPVGIILGKLHPLYHLSVQWFLHFQLQGWFVYCLLGLLLFFLKKGNNLLSFSKKEELYLHLSLFLTFGGTIFHSYAWMGWYWLNLIGVGLQAYVFFRLLLPLWNCTFSNFYLAEKWVKRLIALGIISLLLKATLQLILVIPDVLAASHYIRSYVIAFIHLILLGAVTFGIGGMAIQSRIFPSNTASISGWYILASGFLITELLLFGQGTLAWAKWGSIPAYHQIMFFGSLLFPIGLGMVFVSFYTKGQKDLLCPSTSNLTTKSKNHEKPTKTVSQKHSSTFSLGNDPISELWTKTT